MDLWWLTVPFQVLCLATIIQNGWYRGACYSSANVQNFADNFVPVDECRFFVFLEELYRYDWTT